MYKVYGNVLSTGTKERTIEVLGGFGHSRIDAFTDILQNVYFNQFTSGILYFFRSPVRDYFQ